MYDQWAPVLLMQTVYFCPRYNPPFHGSTANGLKGTTDPQTYKQYQSYHKGDNYIQQETDLDGHVLTLAQPPKDPPCLVTKEKLSLSSGSNACEKPLDAGGSAPTPCL